MRINVIPEENEIKKEMRMNGIQHTYTHIYVYTHKYTMNSNSATVRTNDKVSDREEMREWA